jgi:hypothetical protein
MRALATGLLLVCSLVAQASELAILATPTRATSFVVAKTGRLAGAICEAENYSFGRCPKAGCCEQLI